VDSMFLSREDFGKKTEDNSMRSAKNGRGRQRLLGGPFTWGQLEQSRAVGNREKPSCADWRKAFNIGRAYQIGRPSGRHKDPADCTR